MGQVVAPAVEAGLSGSSVTDAVYPVINQAVQSNRFLFS